MKLLIATTKDLALHYADVFELDRNDWYFVGLGEAITGRNFDKIVFIPRVNKTLNEHEQQWLDHTLLSKKKFA